MANNKTLHTYQRLIKKVANDIALLRPDADDKLRERLNKKFKKYQGKIELYTAK